MLEEISPGVSTEEKRNLKTMPWGTPEVRDHGEKEKPKQTKRENWKEAHNEMTMWQKEYGELETKGKGYFKKEGGFTQVKCHPHHYQIEYYQK